MIPAEKAERSPFIWPAKRANTVQESATNAGTLPHIGSESSSRWALPVNVWARLVVMFLALAGIKLALVIRLGKSLFEVHWRVMEHLPAWGDYVLFGLFVIVGCLTLVRLQRRCALVGVRAIRAANAIVLSLGLIFIFFTFHAEGKNYLYPILTGILDYGSLIPYLSLDLFFHPPFLAAWLFVYVLSYYILARTGRESSILYMTAIFGTVYAALHLWELAASRNELMVVTSLGLASLVFWGGDGRKTQTGWLVAPLAWGLFFAAELFWFMPPFGATTTYFWLLAYASALLFGGATLLAYKRGFGPGWSRVALFYFASFLLLANRNHSTAINFNNVICLGLEVPHYFLGEVLVVAVLALIAAGHKTLFPRLRYWWLDIASLALIVIAFVDFRLSQIIGTRLGWDVLAQGGNAKMMWRMSRPYLPGAIAGIALLIAAYALTLKVVQFRLERRNARQPRGDGTETGAGRGGPVASSGIWIGAGANSGVWYSATVFIVLGLIGLVTANPDKVEGQAGLRLVETSPIWKRAMTRTMKPEEFLGTARSLGIGEFKVASASASSQADLNVVLVFMESTYNKHLSLFGGTEETQPLLSKYKARMELYPNFFSSFASSIHARFASFTSLYPVRDYNAFTLQHVPVKSLFEVMHDNGYSCSLFYSSFLDYTGFRSFLQGRGLDAIYDADTMPGERKTEPVSWGLAEEETLAAMQSQIKAYASKNQRFFLTYVPAAPHYPYETGPKRFHKYKAGQMGDYSPFYLNALLYMDWVLASIVDQLEESGLLDKTVVIITNDHGEMLGEHGGPIGHGFALNPELVNTPLIIMDPRKPGYRVNPVIGSQVDLLPTMLDLLSIPIPRDELYEGRSLLTGGERSGLMYLNSMQEYGVIFQNWLLLGDRERDNGALTRAFAITNSGARTTFEEGIASPQENFSIQRFDEFQANLLRNYSLYRESMRRSGTLTRR